MRKKKEQKRRDEPTMRVDGTIGLSENQARSLAAGQRGSNLEFALSARLLFFFCLVACPYFTRQRYTLPSYSFYLLREWLFFIAIATLAIDVLIKEGLFAILKGVCSKENDGGEGCKEEWYKYDTKIVEMMQSEEKKGKIENGDLVGSAARIGLGSLLRTMCVL
jgi:hypothetical protein